VIDQTKCIGCHACTTACKSENDVALGVFRTWVKNVDAGVFPETRRHFAVLRCNHCANAPCVAICPTSAMYQRPDGLVDFDDKACIGCKACMQGCPYDAIYIDPVSDTAAKCNFCSHRVDQGLLPACVVVCPVEALVFGDRNDPASRVSRLLAERQVKVRRPEQKTIPHAFYIGAADAALDPLAAQDAGMLAWADRRMSGGADSLRHVRSSAHPPARLTYDIPKATPWGWKVSAYIWTKSIATGAALVPALLHAFGFHTREPVYTRDAAAVALIFLAITGVLLVADLKRPERFWMILVRPQWRSWLAKGAYVISAYGAILAVWVWGLWNGYDRLMDALAWPVIGLSLLTAIYTAFLFGQCEGRDLWQGRLLIFHLALHSLIAGAGILYVIGSVSAHVALRPFAPWLALALGLSAALALLDALGPHRTANARAGAWHMTHGRNALLFWISVLAGMAIPALIFLLLPGWYRVGAVMAVSFGLFGYGHAFVTAGQKPPIS